MDESPERTNVHCDFDERSKSRRAHHPTAKQIFRQPENVAGKLQCGSAIQKARTGRLILPMTIGLIFNPFHMPRKHQVRNFGREKRLIRAHRFHRGDQIARRIAL
jgi:hypothetical protein